MTRYVRISTFSRSASVRASAEGRTLNPTTSAFEAEVRQLFRVSRLGVIAGSYVTTGVVRRGAQVRVVRDGTVIYETTIAQLKRFKDDAREVQEGFECGILLANFNDQKEGDILEVYETRQVERTDLSAPAPEPATTTAGE